MRDISLGDLAPAAIYKLLISLVVPRPIAWVSSLSASGVANLAPHSYFMILATDPAILGFSSVGTKDTLLNIQATGEYVINIAGEELAERLNFSSGDFPPEESEFTWAGLTPAPSLTVTPPSVAEAPVAFETRLLHATPYGNKPNHLIVGEVSHMRVRKSILAAGGDYADPRKLRAIGRMGGPTYSRTTDLFDLERPKYADLVQRGIEH
ncbi:MAG: flavin reductase family protein [Chloroflexota bacterium]|nr:flavin reductase family protein [Chloroflexota bacterium]